MFHAIATFDRSRAAPAMAAFAAGWVLPCAALAVVCQPTVSLSAEEFVRAYVLVRHPSHYLPSAFGSLTARPWWNSFFLLTALMLAAVPYAAWRRDRRLAVLSLAFAAAYVGCVGLQYVAVEAWPIKLLAMLGPVRFSSRGFFAWLLLAALVAADIAKLLVSRWNINAPPEDGRDARTLSSIVLSRRAAFGLLAVGAIAIGITQRDDPILRAKEDRAGLFAWIERNTSPDDVFATSDDYPGDPLDDHQFGEKPVRPNMNLVQGVPGNHLRARNASRLVHRETSIASAAHTRSNRGQPKTGA
jgi:hypothetical protein